MSQADMANCNDMIDNTTFRSSIVDGDFEYYSDPKLNNKVSLGGMPGTFVDNLILLIT